MVCDPMNPQDPDCQVNACVADSDCAPGLLCIEGACQCSPNDPNCADNICDPNNPNDPDCQACDPNDPNCLDMVCDPMNPQDPDCQVICVADSDCAPGEVCQNGVCL